MLRDVLLPRAFLLPAAMAVGLFSTSCAFFIADDDGDGATADVDCDDSNPAVNPSQDETPYDGLDNDCDEATHDDDLDNDGYGREADCDDEDPFRYPDAGENCNGLDDDCDGSVDEDFDADGIGGSDCKDDDGDGQSEDQGDCDDANPAISDATLETCNGIDDDCDGRIDNGHDQDGDGSSTCGATPDCDDTNAAIFPGNTEICDSLDNDCDPTTLENTDADQDGFYTCGETPDCNDANAQVWPGAFEICDNGLDDNCDGLDATSGDADGDGFTTCGDGELDCDDTTATAYPGAAEQCNARDDDCDGVVDDGLISSDEHESNNTPDTATDLGLINGTTELITGALDTEGDEDWFEFESRDDTVDVGGFWFIEVTLDDIPSGANYDVYVYKLGIDVPVGEGTLTGSAPEYIKVNGVGGQDNSGTFRVQVIRTDGPPSCPSYQLTLFAT